MDKILSQFSQYEIKARLFPALLLLAPFLFTVLTWYPELISLGSSILVIVFFIITLFFLAKYCREMGVKKQDKLLKEWGAFPSILILRHRDPVIDPVTKSRYHSFLQEKVKGVQLPTSNEEIENPEYYDIQYKSAIKWLLEYTRDSHKYSLLQQDNINYGFSRNMLGVKSLGILLTILAVGVNIYGIYNEYGFDSLMFPLVIWISLLTNIGFFLFWLLFVNENWVKSTSYAYARTLLACCENNVD